MHPKGRPASNQPMPRLLHLAFLLWRRDRGCLGEEKEEEKGGKKGGKGRPKPT